MTAMTNIKEMITKRSATQQKNDGSKVSKKNALKAAIKAADKRLETSEKIEALAIAEELESQMTRDIAKEIDIEFNLNGSKDNKKPESVDLNGKPLTSNTLKSGVEEKSEHLLELQRKQDAMQYIHLQMQQGVTTLDALAKKSEQISNYLAKSEIELSRLEDVEKRYAKLHSASENLAKEHRELKAKMEEKYKQVNLLEGQKNKTRDMLDKAQLEINRLTEQSNAKSADMNSQDIMLSKLKDENLSIKEKNGLLAHEISELDKQNQDLQKTLDANQNELTDAEKQLSKANLKIDTLTRENEQTAIDSLDIQARYASLNEKYAESASLLEEVKYELDSERSSFDEKLRLKDARIMKMERKIEILTRQISITEQMVTEITDEKTSDLSAKLSEMKKPYCSNPATKSKASKAHLKEVATAV